MIRLLMPQRIGDQKSHPQVADQYAGKTKNKPIFIEYVNEGWHSEEAAHRKKEQKFWRWSLGLSIITVIGALFSAGLAYSAFTQSQRQAEAAEQANRAWIESNVTITANVFTNIIALMAKFDLKNVGHSPALFVLPDIQPYFAATPEEAASFIDSICSSEAQSNVPFGSTIFPDQQLPFNVRFDIDAIRRAVLVNKNVNEKRKANLYIGTCVIYKSASKNLKRHTTRALFYVANKDTGVPIDYIEYLKEGGSHFPTSIFLMPEVSSAKSFEAD